MVQRVEYSNVDDRDGTKIEGEAVKYPLSTEGVSYELDLSQANAQALREAIAPFLTHAEPVSGFKPTRRKRRPVEPTPAPAERKAAKVDKPADKPPAKVTDVDENKLIREWANANGYEVKARGRIAPEVRAKYNEAHPSVGEVEGS